MTHPAKIECNRCGTDILDDEYEFCWYCHAYLCFDCWDTYGHCGHKEAEVQNEYAYEVLVKQFEISEAYPIIVNASANIRDNKIVHALRRLYVYSGFDGSIEQLKSIISGDLKIRGIGVKSIEQLKLAMESLNDVFWCETEYCGKPAKWEVADKYGNAAFACDDHLVTFLYDIGINTVEKI